MKKLLITFLLIATLWISGVFASDIPVSEISTATNECAVSDRYFNYYLVWDKPVIAVDRFYNNTNLVKINTWSSRVKIWRWNWVMFDCDNWTLISNVVPQKNKLPGWAYIWKSNCTFKIPNYTKVNNPTKVDAQINYTVWYHNKKSWWTSINGKFFYTDSTDDVQWWYFKCYKPFWLSTNTLSSCNSDSFKYGNLIIHTWECLNYRIFRCGDWLVNSPYGQSYDNWYHSEQCDPNDPTHLWWNNNGYTCNASCQLVTAPSVQPDLSIEKEQISTWTMEAGSLVEYKITVRNTWSWPAAGVVIYDLLPVELQYMTSSISITPSSTYSFMTGTTQILGVSRTYFKYYNITLNANWSAIVYLKWKVKEWYTFDTLRNCASVSWNNIPMEEDCAEVTPPTPPTPTTCTITLSPDTITFWENATLSYVISGSFYTSTHIYLTGQQLDHWRMPYTVNAQQWSMTIYGDWMANTGIYTFVLQWNSLSGSDFSCTGILNVIDNNTPPPPITWHGDVSIQKILESTWPFAIWDQIQYKIVAENHWDATAIVPIWDIMPEAVTYLTSSIVFVPDTHQNYTFSTGTYNDRFMFRYDNVSLAPWQRAIIYLKWIINDNYIPQTTVDGFTTTISHFNNWQMDCIYYRTNKVIAGNQSDLTTNCAFTYSDSTGDNWSGTLERSCVEFPKPAMIKYQSVRGVDFTRDILEVAKNEIITYKVEFGNQSGEKMDDVHLLDVMPTCVEYVSSKVYGISGYWFSTWLSNNWNVLVSYSWFELWSWQYGYMIVTWRISDSPECENTDIYRNDAYMFYSWGQINSFVIAKRPDVLLTKGWDGPRYNLSQPNAFFITVTNNSNDIIYDVTLSEVDSWPTFSGCVNYIDWKWTNFTKDTNALVWRYNSPLQPSESINLTISWSIWTGVSCIRDYLNTVVLTYKDGAWYSYTLDAKYPFYVDTGESAALDKTVDSHKKWMWDEVVYTISYDNVWTVDRKTWYTLTDIWPSDVLSYEWSNCIAPCREERSGGNIVFTFDSALHPWDGGKLILKWRVKKSRTAQKLNTVILDYSTIFDTARLDDDDYITYTESDCGDWILQWNEECDGWYDSYLNWGSWDRFLIVNYLDYKRTKLAWDYAWRWYYCTQSCMLDKVGSEDYAHNIPSCLNVDTAISLMDNEVFPFWWRIWERDGIEMVHGWKKATSCNKYSTAKNTVINKDAMKCTFAVYDGKSYNQADRKPLNEIEQPCFDDYDSKLDEFFRPFSNEPCVFSWCVDFKQVASRKAWLVSSLFWDKRDWHTYWEYKLALEKVEYQYCEDWTWKDWELYNAVCEVDFALTKSYLMQINTSWTPKATSSDFLNKFYDIAGNKIQTDLSDVIKVNPKSYNVTTNVQAQIDQFRNKYEKLAVTMTNATSIWWEWVTSAKKVPNQSIYFIKWDGVLKLPKTQSITSKPFTIFIEWMDVEINGSILTNGMIITKKTISFKDSDCTSWWQVVQWVFIAQWWFKSNKSTLNTSTDNQWCHRWNLHVKWVLIWSWINNIANSKRSQLNSRFETKLKYNDPNDSRLKAERRNEIIRWASVLIEYNSDVWSKVIPWAEIFTETLDVYRK